MCNRFVKRGKSIQTYTRLFGAKRIYLFCTVIFSPYVIVELDLKIHNQDNKFKTNCLIIEYFLVDNMTTFYIYNRHSYFYLFIIINMYWLLFLNQRKSYVLFSKILEN